MQFVVPICFNSLPDDRISEVFKFRAFADGYLNEVQMIIYVLHNEENIVEKGENAGYQQSLLFRTIYSKAFLLSWLKLWTV